MRSFDKAGDGIVLEFGSKREESEADIIAMVS